MGNEALSEIQFRENRNEEVSLSSVVIGSDSIIVKVTYCTDFRTQNQPKSKKCSSKIRGRVGFVLVSSLSFLPTADYAKTTPPCTSEGAWLLLGQIRHTT